MEYTYQDIDEPGFEYRPPYSESGKNECFAIKPTFPLPANFKPIIDDSINICVGYSVSQAPGLWRIYDWDGKFLTLEETPLQHTLSPVEIGLLALGAFRLLSAGRSVFELASRTVGVRLSAGTQNLLRVRFRMGLSAQNLKFTRTTIARMSDPGRFIPVQILEKAVRYGSRALDPQGKPGLYQYQIQMTRLAKRIRNNEVVYESKEYTLYVVVREKDWTIVHFHIM